MKALLLVLSLLSSASCFAGCAQEAKIAVQFMNEYLVFGEPSHGKTTTETLEKWLKRNPLVTRRFSQAYGAMIQTGRKNDPELGWGTDIILDAQDSPDKGFKLFRCSRTPGFLLLQGTDWPEFRVTVKVVTTSQGMKVDGAGAVNIPESERAPRY